MSNIVSEEELIKFYEKEYSEKSIDSLYGVSDEKVQEKVDKMVENMNFKKLGVKEFLQAQKL